MTQIEKLHLDAINSSREWEELDGELVVDRQLAASKSAQITEDISIEFAEWIKKLWVIKKGKYIHKGDFYNQDKNNYTTREIFQIFLKQRNERIKSN